jgi:ubiquinone/menaquinone biosynthesis C-methylase UbiE
MKIIENATYREQQAKKILKILNDYFGDQDFSHFRCLEVGCGSGKISAYFADKVEVIWGIDISIELIDKDQLMEIQNLGLSRSDGAKLPFSNSSFDLILLPQVYEHTLKQKDVIAEVHRVLRLGGVCFFSGPNKFQIIERHYFLPFLSWLPNKWSTAYLRLTHKGNIYDIYPRTFCFLKKLTRNFKRIDYTSRIIHDPDKFGLSDRFGKLNLRGVVPLWVIRLFEPFFPNYNWILVKEK